MSNFYRTKAFVLAKNDLREADQVFDVYTQDFGRLKILGRAIRKIKSKLKAGIEVFYLSEIEFIQGRIYKTLTDSIVIDKFGGLRNDLVRRGSAHRIAELIDILVHDQEKDEEVWNLLEETLNILNSCDLKDEWTSDIIYYSFLWNFFSLSGYQIDLHNCSACHDKLLPEGLCFNPEEGGITCSPCSASGGERISPNVIKVLRLFLSKDWETVLKLKMSGEEKRVLELISQNYLNHFRHKEIKDVGSANFSCGSCLKV